MSIEIAQQFNFDDDDDHHVDVIVITIELRVRDCLNQFDGLKMSSLIL